MPKFYLKKLTLSGLHVRNVCISSKSQNYVYSDNIFFFVFTFCAAWIWFILHFNAQVIEKLTARVPRLDNKLLKSYVIEHKILENAPFAMIVLSADGTSFCYEIYKYLVNKNQDYIFSLVESQNDIGKKYFDKSGMFKEYTDSNVYAMSDADKVYTLDSVRVQDNCLILKNNATKKDNFMIKLPGNIFKILHETEIDLKWLNEEKIRI